MTMASSTSQSVFGEPRGMITVSLGPTMQDGALLNTIGSAGIGRAGFGGVIRIIQADGDEVSHIADAGAETLAGRHQRQRCGIDGLETREALGAERIARNVRDKPREVADVARPHPAALASRVPSARIVTNFISFS